MQSKRKLITPTKQLSDEKTKAMRSQLDALRSRVHAAKIAFLNRTPFQDKEVTFDDLQQIAKDYIQKSYAYQRAVFGKVHVKISVAKLLR